MKNLWGIDLGGTKVEGVVLKSAEEPEVLIRQRLPAGSQKGYEHILNQIGSLVEAIGEELGQKPDIIGMGTPGSLDPSTGKLKNSNSVALNGMPFKEDVEKILGIPVEMANDANCFALAETKMGAVREYCPSASVVFGVIMGTGVGGGIVVDGKVLNGIHGIGGEWGHNYLDESGGPCYCGKAGCVEKVISGPALESYYERVTGTQCKLREIVERSVDGSDKAAVATMERLIKYFGLGLSNVINILDPDIVLIGGGVGNIDLLYSDGVKEIEKYVFNPNFRTLIKRPMLGDSAGVFGAAFLVAGKD